MNNIENQRLSQKLITLTTNDLERGKKIPISNVSNKSSQKTPLVSKFLAGLRKINTRCSPNRPKSRSQHRRDQFDEVLGEKLAAIFCNRKTMTPSLKNYKKTGLHYKKNVSASKKESCSKRSSSSKKRGRKSELKKNESKSYYTQNSLNISKLLRRDKHKSPSILLTKGKPKVRHIDRKSVV